MTSLLIPHQTSEQHPSPARLYQPLLLASALGAATLIATPAQASNQYCNFADARSCRSGAVASGETYFWAPKTQPSTIFANQRTIDTGVLDMGVRRFPSKTNITLRSPSGWTLNAKGTNTAEILIGSLGKNNLLGNGGGDTYVIGNTYADISNLSACDPTITTDCLKSNNVAAFENDTVELVDRSKEVIYIDRCLQVTATGTPGLGGNLISSASPPPNSFPNYSGSDLTFVNSCPPLVASLRHEGLWSVAQRGRETLLAPWQRWWPASTAWNQAIGWLQQALTALIQGPHAVGQPLGMPQIIGQDGVIKDLVPSNQSKVPSYPGVARLIQSSEGNFLKDTGDKIVVDGSTRTFNGQPLSSIGEVGKVYPQRNNKDEIPLNQGIALVYHQQIGILASYGTDRYPYGTKKNPGTVIAQLVLRNGRALPARSIDSVSTVNLSRSAKTAPARRTGDPANLLRPRY
jgi:hypothetical protein